MNNHRISQYRDFLKDTLRTKINFAKTDQHRGFKAPPIEKPYGEDKKLIQLPGKENWSGFDNVSLMSAIENRKSHRKYNPVPLTIAELSFLLWATQGIRQVIGRGTALRTVPSAGCRHAFETYPAVMNIENLSPGIYRYLPIEHALIHEFEIPDLADRIVTATLGQVFTGRAAVTFIWSVLPYRTEWRYDIAAHRVLAMDAGHVCQNLYLACEAVGSGTCAVAAYDQQKMDELLQLDGENEFVIYLAPVGKVSKKMDNYDRFINIK